MEVMNDIFKNTINELNKSYDELGQMKKQLLSMSLDSFNYLFEGEKPLYKNIDAKTSQETISALKKDLLPLFEENKFDEGIETIQNYIKLLQENLEEPK